MSVEIRCLTFPILGRYEWNCLYIWATWSYSGPQTAILRVYIIKPLTLHTLYIHYRGGFQSWEGGKADACKNPTFRHWPIMWMTDALTNQSLTRDTWLTAIAELPVARVGAETSAGHSVFENREGQWSPRGHKISGSESEIIRVMHRRDNK